MGLDPDTVRRMRECFGGETCCQCGQPAERLAHDRFYCHGHFPYNQPAGEDTPRRHTVSQSARLGW